jgi:hypothetical protein
MSEAMSSTTSSRDHVTLVFFIMLGVLAAGCRSISVKGVIATDDDHPIANALITLQPGERAGRSFAGSSEPNGCFNLYETIPRDQGRYLMVVESPGYKPLSIPVAVRVENLLLVTLEPTASSRPSAARPISPGERYARYVSPCDPEFKANSLTLH